MTTVERPINLQQIARDTLARYGFLVDIPPAARSQADALTQTDFSKTSVTDLSSWLWSSIDNDDSRDLDQIEFIKEEPQGLRLYIGIADVSALVARDTAIDQAAQNNTTSLYTGVRTYPLLPEKLSTNLTSLLEGQKRWAVVTEMMFSSDGQLTESTVYRAVVQNKAQLTYTAVAAWLEKNSGDASEVTRRVLSKIQASSELQDQLQQQHRLALLLRKRRVEAGALTLETIELRPSALPDGRVELKSGVANEATHLIEDFMIAANQASVSYLESKGFSSLRRIVRTPKNWLRIVELAAKLGVNLPAEPDAAQLEDFLRQQHAKDPDHFPDLSLSVIKLLGRGEYVVATPGQKASGHFALAVRGYSHSTAPNRRYPDLITQRMMKAAIDGEKPPYSDEALALLAQHCTQKEDDAHKAERSIHKSLAASAMSHQIGQTFEGFITGASDKGVWVRVVSPPVEGRLEGAVGGLKVGDRVAVKLVSTDIIRGYIDFNVVSQH